MTGNVLDRIRNNYTMMSKGHKAIAGYILNNIDEAVFMTAAKMGAAIGVSESTVVRFAAGLGFDGFPAFQKALEECVRGKLNSSTKLDSKSGLKSQSEILTSVLKSDMDKIRDTIDTLNPDAFKAAVTLLLEADTVYIMGLRSNEPLAGFLHFYLSMCRPNVILLNTTSVTETFEQMIRISGNDCFVGISFPRYSMRTLKAMEFANDRNARCIAITDSAHSPMNLYSSCNLFAKSELMSVVDSLVAPMSVINALIVAMCMERPKEVSDHLHMLETTWNDYQVYQTDEIDFIDDEPFLDYSLKKDQ